MYEAYAGAAPRYFHHRQPFPLEVGAVLPELTVAYHTYGTLSPGADNVIWVCHALTANSDVADWFPGTVRPGGLFDPDKYFIVCANKLGSPYGSSSPMSLDPATGEPWYLDFPEVTVRDMVRAHQLLRQHLGIRRIAMIYGGSTGGAQAMEWSYVEPDLFGVLALAVIEPKASPWVVASSEAQRMAIEADPTFFTRHPEGGGAGMAAARAMSMLLYRNSTAFCRTQEDREEKCSGYRAASYQRYQGQKLRRRFNAHCYYRLLQSLDSHDMGRGRGGVEAALGRIPVRTVVISVDSDILFPPAEVRRMAEAIGTGGADYHEITSDFGHDGFLIETEAITRILKPYLG